MATFDGVDLFDFIDSLDENLMIEHNLQMNSTSVVAEFRCIETV